MKKLWFIFSLFLFFETKGQSWIVVVKNTENKPLAFASVIVNDGYGILTDSLGRFSFYDYEKPQKMEVHKVGYQSTYLNHTQLRAKQEIILSKDTFVPISKTLSGSELTIGYKEKEKLKEDFHLNIYKNYETGVAFKYEEEYEGKTITGIRLRAYFIGGKGFPLRVNLYDLDEDGLPKNILLKEELVIRPTDKKEWFELELSKQGITFPKSGVAITIEPLNPQMRRVSLNKEYRPVLSSFVSEDFKWVYRGNAWPVWKTGGGKTYAMQLKMR